MSTVHELEHILARLIEVWPGEHHHPSVEQARIYLQSNQMPSVRDSRVGEYRVVHMDMPSGDEHQDASWYSI